MERKVYSNAGRDNDLVLNPLKHLAECSAHVHLAAPYFTKGDLIQEILEGGSSVCLLVGLNATTSPDALRDVLGSPDLQIRYFTRHFHAKMYLFDDGALVGSSNLTDGGLIANREAMVHLDSEEDAEALDEVRALFTELWQSAHVLTPEALKRFADIEAELSTYDDLDRRVEEAVGKAEPEGIDVGSRSSSKEQLFLQDLRQRVHEQYGLAFREVSDLLESNALRRLDLALLGATQETSRFLNYVRVVHASGDEAWQNAPYRNREERRAKVLGLGHEWVGAPNNRVSADYSDKLASVARVFGNPDALASATMEEVTEGLMSIHAFSAQRRFVPGGEERLRIEFWRQEGNELKRVKSVLQHLLFGEGEDFIQRLHDLLYEPGLKLKWFGKFCAIELFGTIHPTQCPPMNGRMAKALRFLGYDVKGT